eukprot:TRINITY_DN101122_c0_g1_i1.p1 TRINITY_DN101122_c0_g1~~TRINITY_DN101122_c0_g1_i1.p1  ORF type:complete len:476 (+),score=101.74 TRINITY_DN101122_c0_g1_i1:174-1430(+)
MVFAETGLYMNGCSLLEVKDGRTSWQAEAPLGGGYKAGDSCRLNAYTKAPAQTMMTEDQPAEKKPAQKTKSTWRKYASIENSYREGHVNKVRRLVESQLGADAEWVATEKVHGSNFCFETDGTSINHASRVKILKEDADFFNVQTTMPKYHPYVLNAFASAKQRYPGLQSLLIYGEYFGGYYPGHKSKSEAGLKKVQIGIAYSPGHHFYAFDVALNGEQFMDFDEARDLLLHAGFPLVAAPLWRGSLHRLLEIDVETFHTTLPKLLGHEPIQGYSVAEGLILRPTKEVVGGDLRPILKNKSKAFWESQNSFGMAERVAARQGAEGQKTTPLQDAVKDAVTESRLHAVVSKDPELLREGMEKKLIGLFCEDILSDLEKLRLSGCASLSKEERSSLKAFALFSARKFVYEKIVQIRSDFA